MKFSRITRRILPYGLALLSIGLFSCKTESSQEQKIPIKVVIVSMFERDNDTGDVPGEFQHWVEGVPLAEVVPFPQGYRDLRLNREKGILGIVTSVGNTKAAVSITALGHDDRFDLSEAYWLVAGISGIDPEDASTGSAIWADWILDGDLSHEIDAREIPADWKTGYIPLRKSEPYELPYPKEKEEVAIQLNPKLVNWAYELTKDTPLTEHEGMVAMRANYTGYTAEQHSPTVQIGAQLAASTYWHGELLNDWANDWVTYWTEGQANFITSAMEEMGTYHSLDRLHQVGLVDKNRLMVLRTGSNYTMQWPGITAHQSLSGEKLSGKGYSAYRPSLSAAYDVGSVVVNQIIDNWDEMKNGMP